MNHFKIGMELYHKNKKTRCIIVEIDNKNIKVQLDQKIDGKSELTLPKTHIGYWLFYKKEHVNLDMKQLAMMKEYECGTQVSKYIKEHRPIEIPLKPWEQMIAAKAEKEKSYSNLALEKILRDRNIISLVHFTRIENLDSILMNGFIPRNQLDKQKKVFHKNDDKRLDGKSNCTCFSIEFPNNYLFERFRHDQPESKWVVLKVDAELLAKHKGNKYYCYDNAARGDIRYKLLMGELGTPIDFENMFCEEYTYERLSGSGSVTRKYITGIQEYLPTSKQAEILISDIISSGYIKSICFNNEDDYQNYINTSSLSDAIQKFEFEIDERYFLKREQVKFSPRRQISG